MPTLRRTNPIKPKAYLYVSDAKVDMLIDGLPPALRDRYDLKLKVGVPGLGDAEVARREREAGRFARAERLCAALDAVRPRRVGSLLDHKSEFVHGELIMTWGFWNRYNKGYADVVFFSGFVDERTFVGLGGSAYHTMERAEERLQQCSNSGLQTLMAFLEQRADAGSSQSLSHRTDPPGAWQNEAWEADHDNPMVPERLEFFAQRLLDDHDPMHGIRTIIGSPVYVARTGQPTTRRMLKDYEALRDQHALMVQQKRRLERRHGDWQIGKPSWPKLPPWSDADLTPPDDT